MLKLLNKLFSMNKITVHGTTTHVSGRNITVYNDKVYVDGKLVAEGLSGEVKIKFEGDLASLDAANVEVSGSVKGPVDGTNITVHGDITGNVDGTNIKANVINGKVDGTNITCKNINR